MPSDPEIDSLFGPAPLVSSVGGGGGGGGFNGDSEIDSLFGPASPSMFSSGVASGEVTPPPEDPGLLDFVIDTLGVLKKPVDEAATYYSMPTDAAALTTPTIPTEELAKAALLPKNSDVPLESPLVDVIPGLNVANAIQRTQQQAAEADLPMVEQAAEYAKAGGRAGLGFGTAMATDPLTALSAPAALEKAFGKAALPALDRTLAGAGAVTSLAGFGQVVGELSRTVDREGLSPEAVEQALQAAGLLGFGTLAARGALGRGPKVSPDADPLPSAQTEAQGPPPPRHPADVPLDTTRVSGANRVAPEQPVQREFDPPLQSPPDPTAPRHPSEMAAPRSTTPVSEVLAAPRHPADIPLGTRVPVDAPVDIAARDAATSPDNALPEPTEAQKEAGNYAKGHTRVAGMDISIENQAGTKRRPEWPDLQQHYGYIRRTTGADGDHVDAFIKPGTPEDYQGPIYVVNQTKSDVKMGNPGFDEHKVMVGFDSLDSARAAYMENYTPGWDRVQNVVEFQNPGEFKAWLETAGATKKPAPLQPHQMPEMRSGATFQLPGEGKPPADVRRSLRGGELPPATTRNYLNGYERAIKPWIDNVERIPGIGPQIKKMWDGYASQLRDVASRQTADFESAYNSLAPSSWVPGRAARARREAFGDVASYTLR